MATTDTHVVQISLEDLHESPFNPRKHFDEAGLQELAEDIKAHGRILQPLLVRPRIPELFRGMEDAADTAACGFELVFGHRRLRAAQLAGLTSAPCMVSSMTDLEVKRAQISENLQRRDVHPIEEAEGFQALIDDHGETADSIAEQTGKSRSYVYGRLKLLALSPALRDACLSGKIGAEAALLVARLRHHKLQDKALQYIHARNQSLTDGGQQSYRRIRDLLVEHFTLDLKEAPFPLDDATLVPAAGDCRACPKRSANAPEYSDVLDDTKRNQWSRQAVGPNVCTDPDCHQAKKVAVFKRQAEAMRADGHEVVDGNKARAALDAYGKVRGSYVAASVATPKIASARKEMSRKGLQPPKQVQLQDPRTGRLVPAYRLADLQSVGLDLSPPPSRGTPGGQQAGGESREAREARIDAERKAAEGELMRRRGLFERLRTEVAARSERTADEARIVALALVEYARDNDQGGLLADLWGVQRDHHTLDEVTAAWRDRVASMTRDDIARLMIDCALMRGAMEVGYWEVDDIEPHGIDAMARLYGIDPAGPFPTPPTCCAGSEEAGDADAQDGGNTEPAAGAGADQAASTVVWPFPMGRPAGSKQTDKAGSAGQEQTDDAGVTAGGRTAAAEAVQ